MVAAFGLRRPYVLYYRHILPRADYALVGLALVCAPVADVTLWHDRLRVSLALRLGADGLAGQRSVLEATTCDRVLFNDVLFGRALSVGAFDSAPFAESDAYESIADSSKHDVGLNREKSS